MRSVVALCLLTGCQLVFSYDPPPLPPPDPIPCSSISKFSQAFDGPLSVWWDASQPEITVTPNQVLDLFSRDQIVAAKTFPFFDLRDGGFTIEVSVTAAPWDSTASDVWMNLITPTADHSGEAIEPIIHVALDNSTPPQRFIQAGIWRDDLQGYITPSRRPYTEDIRYWRIAKVGDMLESSISRDNVNYEVIDSQSYPFSTNVGRLEVGLKALGGDTITMTVNNINGEVTREQACPIDLLIDSFDGPELDTDFWEVSGDRCSATAQPAIFDGKLQLVFSGQACAVTSRFAYNLLDGEGVAIRAPIGDIGADQLAYLAIRPLGSSNALQLARYQTGVEAAMNGVLAGKADPLPWWRVRATSVAGGTVIFEQSSDRVNWIVVGQGSVTDRLDAVRIELGVAGPPPQTQSQVISFDSVNSAEAPE